MEELHNKVVSKLQKMDKTHVSILKTANSISRDFLDEAIIILSQIQADNARLLLQRFPNLTEKEAYDRWMETEWAKTIESKLKELAATKLTFT